MSHHMILFLGEEIPLPGEVFSLPYAVLKESLPASLLEKKEKFVVFYNHFMNLYHIASCVQIVGFTQNEGENIDVWMKGISLVVIQEIFPATAENPTMCSISYVKDMKCDTMPEEDRIDVERYARTRQFYSPLQPPLPAQYGMFDIMSMMKLSIVEKFYALSIPSIEEQYVYMINTLRLRIAYDMQVGSIDFPFFLN